MTKRQPDIQPQSSLPAPQDSLPGIVSFRPAPAGAVALTGNAAWSQVVEPGSTVVVRAGRAWVTFEGDGEDHLLDAGASFTAPARGRVAVQALSPVQFVLDTAASRRAA